VVLKRSTKAADADEVVKEKRGPECLVLP